MTASCALLRFGRAEGLVVHPRGCGGGVVVGVGRGVVAVVVPLVKVQGDHGQSHHGRGHDHTHNDCCGQTMVYGSARKKIENVQR